VPDDQFRLVLPSKASESDGSAVAQDKEKAFEKFLTELYGDKPAEDGNKQQFLKLLAEFEGFITTTKLLTADDVIEESAADGTKIFITFTIALGKFKQKINADNANAIGSKEKFEKIAFLIMKDDTISKDFKKQVLMDLYSPLYYCAEGAEGELQSKYILLNAASLQERLALFAKAIPEGVWLTTDGSIHARNRYVWYTYKAGLSVMGPITKDDYSGGLTEKTAQKQLLPAIDKHYNLESFVSNVVSDISVSLADIDLGLVVTNDFKQKIISRLKFIDFNEQDFTKLFKWPLKMPYGKAVELVMDIFSLNITNFTLLEPGPKEIIDIQKLPHEESFHIINQDGVISFVMFDSERNINISYQVTSQLSNTALYAALLEFARGGPSGIYNLAEILKKNAGLQLNTEFLRYQTLKAMSKEGLLHILENTQTYSKSLGKDLNSIDLQSMTTILDADHKYSMIFCPMHSKNEFYFEVAGQYVDIAQAAELPNFMKALNRLMLGMDANEFVNFISYVQYPLDVMGVIYSGDKLKLLENYLTTLTPKASSDLDLLSIFFKKETIKNLLAGTNEDIKFIRIVFDNVIAELKADELADYFVPSISSAAHDINHMLITHLMQKAASFKDNKEIDSFIKVLKLQSADFASWLDAKDDNQISGYLDKCSTQTQAAFLASDQCKLIISNPEHHLYKLITNKFELVFKTITPEQTIYFLKPESNKEDEEYNDKMFERIIGRIGKSSLPKEKIIALHTLMGNFEAVCVRNMNEPAVLSQLESILNGITSPDDLIKLFNAQPCQKFLVAEGLNPFKEKFDDLLPILHQDEILKYFIAGESADVRAHNHKLVEYLLRYQGNQVLPIRELIKILPKQPESFGAWLKLPETAEHKSDLTALLKRLNTENFISFAQLDVVKQHMIENPEGSIKHRLLTELYELRLDQFFALFSPNKYIPGSEAYYDGLMQNLLVSQHREFSSETSQAELIAKHSDKLIDWLKFNHKENSFDSNFLKIANECNIGIDLLASKHGKEALADACRDDDANEPINKFLQLNIRKFNTYADWARLMFTIEDASDPSNSHINAEQHNDRIISLMLQHLDQFKHSNLEELVNLLLTSEKFKSFSRQSIRCKMFRKLADEGLVVDARRNESITIDVDGEKQGCVLYQIKDHFVLLPLNVEIDAIFMPTDSLNNAEWFNTAFETLPIQEQMKIVKNCIASGNFKKLILKYAAHMQNGGDAKLPVLIKMAIESCDKELAKHLDGELKLARENDTYSKDLANIILKLCNEDPENQKTAKVLIDFIYQMLNLQTIKLSEPDGASLDHVILDILTKSNELLRLNYLSTRIIGFICHTEQLWPESAAFLKSKLLENILSIVDLAAIYNKSVAFKGKKQYDLDAEKLIMEAIIKRLRETDAIKMTEFLLANRKIADYFLNHENGSLLIEGSLAKFPTHNRFQKAQASLNYAKLMLVNYQANIKADPAKVAEYLIIFSKNVSEATSEFSTIRKPAEINVKTAAEWQGLFDIFIKTPSLKNLLRGKSKDYFDEMYVPESEHDRQVQTIANSFLMSASYVAIDMISNELTLELIDRYNMNAGYLSVLLKLALQKIKSAPNQEKENVILVICKLLNVLTLEHVFDNVVTDALQKDALNVVSLYLREPAVQDNHINLALPNLSSSLLNLLYTKQQAAAPLMPELFEAIDKANGMSKVAVFDAMLKNNAFYLVLSTASSRTLEIIQSYLINAYTPLNVSDISPVTNMFNFVFNRAKSDANIICANILSMLYNYLEAKNLLDSKPNAFLIFLNGSRMQTQAAIFLNIQNNIGKFSAYFYETLIKNNLDVAHLYIRADSSLSKHNSKIIDLILNQAELTYSKISGLLTTLGDVKLDKRQCSIILGVLLEENLIKTTEFGSMASQVFRLNDPDLTSAFYAIVDKLTVNDQKAISKLNSMLGSLTDESNLNHRYELSYNMLLKRLKSSDEIESKNSKSFLLLLKDPEFYSWLNAKYNDKFSPEIDMLLSLVAKNVPNTYFENISDPKCVNFTKITDLRLNNAYITNLIYAIKLNPDLLLNDLFKNPEVAFLIISKFVEPRHDDITDDDVKKLCEWFGATRSMFEKVASKVQLGVKNPRKKLLEDISKIPDGLALINKLLASQDNKKNQSVALAARLEKFRKRAERLDPENLPKSKSIADSLSFGPVIYAKKMIKASISHRTKQITKQIKDQPPSKGGTPTNQG